MVQECPGQGFCRWWEGEVRRIENITDKRIAVYFAGVHPHASSAMNPRIGTLHRPFVNETRTECRAWAIAALVPYQPLRHVVCDVFCSVQANKAVQPLECPVFVEVLSRALGANKGRCRALLVLWLAAAEMLCLSPMWFSPHCNCIVCAVSPRVVCSKRPRYNLPVFACAMCLSHTRCLSIKYN